MILLYDEAARVYAITYFRIKSKLYHDPFFQNNSTYFSQAKKLYFEKVTSAENEMVLKAF